MVEIIQISDLHYGSREFYEDYLLNAINYINDLKPDIVICTGDLTHKGSKQQYEGIVKYIDKIKVPLLNVIGNHDARNHGIVFFERFIGPRRNVIAIAEKDTFIMGVRSPRDNTSEGELGDAQIDWMYQKLKNSKELFKILALHHHVIAVPSAGAKRTTLIDAGEVLQLVQEFKIDLVLQGHRHVPHVWQFGNAVLLYCGTTASGKVRADDPPCFNHISLNRDELKAYVVNSKNLEKNLLIHQIRGKMNYIKPRTARIEHIVKSNIFS